MKGWRDAAGGKAMEWIGGNVSQGRGSLRDDGEKEAYLFLATPCLLNTTACFFCASELALACFCEDFF